MVLVPCCHADAITLWRRYKEEEFIGCMKSLREKDRNQPI